VSTCDYKYHDGFIDFECPEIVHNSGLNRCIFHDVNYLKDHNYEKNREEVYNRFKRKLSKYRSHNMPLKFIGYCLPDISFADEEFSKEIYFSDATFYGKTTFAKAKFFSETYFEKTKFSGEASFSDATFSGQAWFESAKFSGEVLWTSTLFSR